MGHGIYAVPYRLECNGDFGTLVFGGLELWLRATAKSPKRLGGGAAMERSGGCGGSSPCVGLRAPVFRAAWRKGGVRGGNGTCPPSDAMRAPGLRTAWQHASEASARASVASARARVRGFRARTREGKSFLHQGFRCVCCMFFFVIA
jgi:hypothetical protein